MALSNKNLRIVPSSDCRTELDRISDLPEDVLNQILSKLWLKDSVKTSVLSTKWRYKYATRPSLVFDNLLVDYKMYASSESETYIARTNKVVSLIDRVLFVHTGPIHKFELSVDYDLPIGEIEKWILFVSRRNPKVFVFSGTDGVMTPFRMSSSLFSCQSLTDLKLELCSLLLPSTFGGFKNLKCLYLDHVEVDEDVLESLISSSLVLERLTISYCNEIKHLCINAPSIQQLTIDGFFFHLSLENTPHLAVFSIEKYDDGRVCEDGTYFKKLLAGMPQIQRLNIGYEFLCCMTIDDGPRDIPVSLVKLHHVSIGVNFNELEDTLFLLSLLNCAPNIQELHIQSESYLEPSTNSLEYENMNGPFKHLRCLELHSIMGSKEEMDFISFMLSTLPTLETMTISLSIFLGMEPENTFQVREQVMKQLLLFGRASPKAKIIIS